MCVLLFLSSLFAETCPSVSSVLSLTAWERVWRSSAGGSRVWGWLGAGICWLSFLLWIQVFLILCLLSDSRLYLCFFIFRFFVLFMDSMENVDVFILEGIDPVGFKSQVPPSLPGSGVPFKSLCCAVWACPGHLPPLGQTGPWQWSPCSSFPKPGELFGIRPAPCSGAEPAAPLEPLGRPALWASSLSSSFQRAGVWVTTLPCEAGGPENRGRRRWGWGSLTPPTGDKLTALGYLAVGARTGEREKSGISSPLF